jgi:hypothetical protein
VETVSKNNNTFIKTKGFDVIGIGPKNEREKCLDYV